MVSQSNSRLYEREGDGAFVSPFQLTISPMLRLLLLNFERDPDTVYIGFEPQAFDDPVHGKGLLVIAYRRDGKVDVYHQPSLRLDPDDYDIVGLGLNSMNPRPFEDAVFDIHPSGVALRFSFDDSDGRLVEVQLYERDGRRRSAMTILAPLGQSTHRPPGLPIFSLYGFNFVRRGGTEIRITIDGREHRPDRFPIPIDNARIYFIRYASDPFLVTWNTIRSGTLAVYRPAGAGVLHDGPVSYELSDQSGHYELRQMHGSDGQHSIRFDFTPAFPDWRALRDGAAVEGRFSITCTPTIGALGGTYRISREGQLVRIRLHPVDGWQPSERHWAMRLAFVAVRVLRNWPKTYVWEAEIDVSDPDAPRIQAAWNRLA